MVAEHSVLLVLAFTELVSIFSLNVTSIFPDLATDVEPPAGLKEVTVGGVISSPGSLSVVNEVI